MKSHILIVDDELRLVQCLAMTLEDEGYEVSIALDGQEGLDQVEAIAPDLIILDWDMPKLSGIELCQQIRASGLKTPIVMATGMCDRQHRMAGLNAGANEYITKPYSVNEILKTIETLLNKTHQHVA